MQKKSNPQLPENNQSEKVEQTRQIPVTQENAPILQVHFLQQIYARLGYIIKLIEEKKGK